jgi:tRNA pseudouridine38-40 synthase
VRYFFRVEYDGTDYHGWQRQPNGMSIQESLETALSTAARQACAVVGGGRTDAGVHARRQGAHVDLDGTFDLHILERSVNALLPPAIAMFHLAPAPEGFHARYSAVSRRYHYYVRRRKTPLDHRHAWVMGYPLDWERVSRELASIVGTHDFAAFNAAGSSVDEPVCTVRTATLVQSGDQWVFCLEANRFVYRMVRSIVGTVVDIARGALDDSLRAVVDSRDRSRAGPSAPARGLVLEDIVYPGVDG